MLAGVAGALGRAAVARARTAERAEELALGRAVVLRITSELEGAVVPREPGAPERFVVVPPADGTPPWSELRFASAAGDLLRYGVRRDARTTGALVRRVVSRFDPPDSGEPAGVPLAGRVVRFDVRCFDGGEWRTAWNLPVLPRAVEVTLGVADGAGGVDVYATTVALPLAGS